jgi:hypothetical protein
MTTAIPAIPDLQQPIAVTRWPVTAQKAQFGVAPPSMADDPNAMQIGGFCARILRDTRLRSVERR